MSNAESFLQRWARRKREAAASTTPVADSASDAAVGSGPSLHGADTGGAEQASEGGELPGATGGESPLPAIDLATLPSLDSITAETDIRPFLLPGVPAELSRAALRRAWSADPAIREFVGLADYDWDFNAEGAIPGFGPLEMTDELRRQVSKMVGRSLSSDELEGSGSPPAGETTSDECENSGVLNGFAQPTPVEDMPTTPVIKREAAPPDGSPRTCEEFEVSPAENLALQHVSQATGQSVTEEQKTPSRRHGRALPK